MVGNVTFVGIAGERIPCPVCYITPGQYRSLVQSESERAMQYTTVVIADSLLPPCQTHASCGGLAGRATATFLSTCLVEHGRFPDERRDANRPCVQLSAFKESWWTVGMRPGFCTTRLIRVTYKGSGEGSRELRH